MKDTLNKNDKILEKRLSHMEEFIRHKKLILDSCGKIAKHFLLNGDEEFALNIMRRACSHDISKLTKEEFHAQDAFGSLKKHSKKRQKDFSDSELSFLKLHWSRNRHHPEHWENVFEMNELDIVEMVCDWHARSIELNDNLFKYIEYRQSMRFKFPDTIYEKILYYAKILIT